MQVLLVDDDPSVCAVIARILTRQFDQLQIVECHDGLEALDMLSRDTYALVLLDLQMPTMDGFDVLESLRRGPATAPVSVIVMTGVSDEATVRRILTYGISDFILKPVRPAQLCERVSRVLSQLTPEKEKAKRTAFVPLELGSGTRVLIADGDSEFRQFFRKTPLLQKSRVEMAGSGVEAFQRSLEQRPDIVFIGSELGLLCGQTLARKIRTHGRLTHTRIIGIESQKTLVQTRKRGIYEAVIVRTFVADVLSEALTSLLRRPGTSSVVALIPDLKLVAMSASEEALSAALTRSVSCTPAGALHSRWTAATVSIQVGREAAVLQVRLSVASKNVAKLAHRLAGHGVPKGSIAEPLPTLLTEVAHTMAAELRCRNLAVVVSDPVSSRASQKKSAEAVPTASDDIAVELEVVGERLSLRLDVSVTPSVSGM